MTRVRAHYCTAFSLSEIPATTDAMNRFGGLINMVRGAPASQHRRDVAEVLSAEELRRLSGATSSRGRAELHAKSAKR